MVIFPLFKKHGFPPVFEFLFSLFLLFFPSFLSFFYDFTHFIYLFLVTFINKIMIFFSMKTLIFNF